MTVPACDEPDPGAEVVRVVREAELTHSYRGSKKMVFGFRDAKTSEFIVTHFAGQDGKIGPTIMETVGPDREHSRTRVDWRSRHDYWLAHPDLLLENYRIQANGPAEIAGRKGTRYLVRSRYEGLARPSVEFVVDGETGLLLSYREMDWKGESSFLAEFTSLVMDPMDLPERPERKARTTDPSKEVGPLPPLPFARLVPRHLPKGFSPKGEGRRAGRSLLGWHTIYSDGLSWFEIRQWKAREGNAPGGWPPGPKTSKGTANVDSEPGTLRRRVRGSRVWMWMTHEGVALMLYGRLDPAEFERVLTSLSVAD